MTDRLCVPNGVPGNSEIKQKLNFGKTELASAEHCEKMIVIAGNNRTDFPFIFFLLQNKYLFSGHFAGPDLGPGTRLFLFCFVTFFFLPSGHFLFKNELNKGVKKRYVR